MSSSRHGPVAPHERIDSLDVLRGFALLGILTMNISVFALPGAAYFNPTVYADFSGLNRFVWFAQHYLADLKFMAIFAMLFGAGIVLGWERASARGNTHTALHYRRMFWLILFGVAHGYLLWVGDILYWYGMCGLVAYAFKRLAPAWLIALGITFIAVTSLIMLAGGLTLEEWPEAELAATVADMDPPADALAAEIADYRGGWLRQMEQRVSETLEMQTSVFVFWALGRVLGLMLLGMALFKLGVLSARRSPRFYYACVAGAVVIGFPLIGTGLSYNEAIDWAAPEFFFLGLQYNYWASLVVALGWIGVIMLLCRARLAILRPLAAVGRTAFSNYILQTLLCTTLFYGHGFGLFGSLERAQLFAIVVAIWALQLSIAPVWLRHFQFGPLEWLWRSLVYWQAQPLKRVSP